VVQRRTIYVVCFFEQGSSKNTSIMSHVVEVDQSGRIEFTSQDTILAFANGINYSILIPSQVKQRCVQNLRRRYHKLKEPYLKMFVVGLFILLRNHTKQLDMVIIDIEFKGLDGVIRGMLLNYLRGIVPDFPKEAIIFRSIGKHSTAHYKAYDTFTKKLKPDYTVSEAEFMELLGK
jgi:hypothetical protein